MSTRREVEGWIAFADKLQQFIVFVDRNSYKGQDLNTEVSLQQNSSLVGVSDEEKEKQSSSHCGEAVASSTGVQKLLLEDEQGDWERKMVITTNMDIKDWRKLLYLVVNNLKLEAEVALKPFSDRRAILVIGDKVNRRFTTFEYEEGLVEV
uniref:Uncharacterized protein n=1 Tax=Nelumbo nucifera TaxID=4432 RepID=A0A822Z6D5_NELNU|nr:TPA_asm: hypothetical protein HUJ06_016247 [Nelumbo nucifera]